jgi:hypothetical protein
MVVFAKSGLRSVRWLSLGICLIILAALLAACGNETAGNNDFTTPTLDGLTLQPGITNDPTVRDKLLSPTKTTIVGQDLKVYTTTTDITTLKQTYRDELVTKRGWLDVSANIVNNSELGTKGSIESFEKYVGGDTNKKHVFGVILLTPDATNNILDTYRASGTIPSKDSSGKAVNVVITIQGATGITADQAKGTP